MRHEGEFPEGRAVRNDFARVLALLALAAFSVAFLLLGSLFLLRFVTNILLGMPVGDPCCTNILNCNPCGKTSAAYYPYLFIALLSFLISAGPWVAMYLYRRSKASENR